MSFSRSALPKAFWYCIWPFTATATEIAGMSLFGDGAGEERINASRGFSGNRLRGRQAGYEDDYCEQARGSAQRHGDLTLRNNTLGACID